jgi:glycerol-3-phosphate cytidylyltransferase-like family protein
MMNANEMQKKFDAISYEDAEVREITCKYFGDEVLVRLSNDSTSEVIYTFLGCDRVVMQHWWGAKLGPVKEYTSPQLDYFAHQMKITVSKKESCSYETVEIDGEIKNVKKDDPIYYECVWDLAPITLTVLCKDIRIEVVEL